MHWYRFLPLSLVCALAVGAFFSVASIESVESDRLPRDEAGYAAWLADHPFVTRDPMTREELKAIPKKDRPDLAMEHDYLMTMDPRTGEVPRERLFAANREVTAFQRSGGGGPLVTEAWEERGPSNVGGRTRAIMFDPNDPNAEKVWAGGVAGGLWYTEDITDAAEPWVNVDDFWANLAVTALTSDPTNPQVFYVGTGEGFGNLDAVRGAGVFKTEDGGTTWNLLPATENQSAFHFVQDVIVDGTGAVYAATRSGGVQRSADGGQTWEEVLGSSTGASTNRAVDLELGADGTVYAAMQSDGIYGSATGMSGSWTDLTAGGSGFPTGGFARIEIATAPSDANTIYAVTANGSVVGGLYKSTDAGATWTAIAEPVDADPGIGNDFTRGQAWYNLILGVDPNNADAVFAGGIDLFKSPDGGASWTQISHWYGGFGEPYVHADQHGIAFRPGSSTEAVFSHDGGIDYTANADAEQPTWINRNLGYNVTQFYAGDLIPTAGVDVMLAGAQDNGTQRFDASGINETDEVRGGDGAFTFFDQDFGILAIASYVYNNFWRSGDAGNNFPVTLLNDSNSGRFINPADYDSRENILYTARTSNSLYRVSNVATAPMVSSIGGITTIFPASHIRVSPYAPAGTSTIFVGGQTARLFKVTNAESASPTPTLINSTGLPLAYVSCIEVGDDEDHLLVTFSSYGVPHVWETVDGGLTWRDKSGNLPDIPVRWALYHPETTDAVLLATEAGVWESANFGAPDPTWTPAPGFPTTRVDMLQYRESDNLVMASTHGRGVFTAPFRPGIVASEGGTEAAVAGTHELAPAYPNPTVTAATFSLTLAQPQRVRVEVYNTVGQRVAVLHDGDLTAGTSHRFTVDGRGLAAGTYLYTVTGERFRDEGRLLLVR